MKYQQTTGGGMSLRHDIVERGTTQVLQRNDARYPPSDHLVATVIDAHLTACLEAVTGNSMPPLTMVVLGDVTGEGFRGLTKPLWEDVGAIAFPLRSLRKLFTVLCFVWPSLVFLLSCGFELPPPQPPVVYVHQAVVDGSVSTSSQLGCDAIIADARGVLKVAGNSRLKFAALLTGNAESGNEPIEVIGLTTRKYKRRSFEDQNAGVEAVESFLHDLGESCRASLPAPSETTPLVPALRRAVQSLRAQRQALNAEGAEPRLSLTIMSDLRAGNRAITCHVRGRRRRCPDLPQVDTTDIAVTVCGVALHSGGQVVDARRQLAVWRKVLGTPALELQATCPRETF